MRWIGTFLVLALGFIGFIHAQTPAHHFVTHADLRWAATAIPNLEMAIVSGDPAKRGPFVIRFRATKPVRIPAHWHPTDENLTVIAGVPSLGMGEHFAAPALRKLHFGFHTFYNRFFGHKK